MENLGKNLLAMLVGGLILLFMEIVLLIAGVVPLSARDPFVGFSRTSPLFSQTRPGYYELNPAKATYFNPQTFQMPKPAGTFRIVVLGGSTTYGRPYQHQTAFGAWLRKLIDRYSRQAVVEVINAGGISYASYRVRRVMEEMAGYDPDLFVVYSGHNEFLEARTFADLRNEPEIFRRLRTLAHHSRIYTVLATAFGRVAGPGGGQTTLGDSVDATLERIGGLELYHRDAQFRSGVIRQYRHEMESMVRFSKAQDIPLILATLPVNLSGISPFKSEHSDQLDNKSLSDWQVAFAAGLDALENDQAPLALDAFHRAEAIDSEYAELYYRMGQAYWRTGDAPLAYQSFDLARQKDIVPLRAINEFNQILREVALAEHVPLADVEQTFLRISPGNIPGENLFVDHVHPSIEGQQLVAWVILNAATDASLVPLDTQSWQAVMPQARDFLRQELAGIPQKYIARGIWSVGRLFFWAGKYPEAYVALSQAWESIKDQPEMARQLGQLEIVRGNYETALTYFDAAERLAPGDMKVSLARASTLNRMGRSGQSLELLTRLTPPDNDQAAGFYHVYGETLMLLGRPGEAAAHYRRAVEIAPGVASYRLSLAENLKRAGDLDGAQRAYSEYLEQLPNPGTVPSLEEWTRER